MIQWEILKIFLFDIILTDEIKEAIKARFDIEENIISGFVGVRYYNYHKSYEVMDVYVETDSSDGYYLEEQLTNEELLLLENIAKSLNK